MANEIPMGWSRVWNLLDTAFADVRAPYLHLEASVKEHEYLAGMRLHTWDMSEDEYHYTLPWLLKDIVAVSAPDPVDNQGGDEVLWSMYPMVPDPGMRIVILRRLGLFNAPQGLAVMAWLEKAKELVGYRLSHDGIDAALAFWHLQQENRRPAEDP